MLRAPRNSKSKSPYYRTGEADSVAKSRDVVRVTVKMASSTRLYIAYTTCTPEQEITFLVTKPGIRHYICRRIINYFYVDMRLESGNVRTFMIAEILHAG